MNPTPPPLSDRLLVLAADVRRISHGWSDDPEAVDIQREGLAERLTALARKVNHG